MSEQKYIKFVDGKIDRIFEQTDLLSEGSDLCSRLVPGTLKTWGDGEVWFVINVKRIDDKFVKIDWLTSEGVWSSEYYNPVRRTWLNDMIKRLA